MDKYEHVYCTNCENFNCIMNCIEDNPYPADCTGCKCKGCNCDNCEDSMRLEDRPNYKPYQL